MWQRHALKEDQLRSEVRFSLPVLSRNQSLLSSRPQLHSNKLLKRGKEIVCTLNEDTSRFPSATRFTKKHLDSRHMEVSQWLTQISERIGQVDLEITAVEQVKDTAEHCLQEKQLYSPLMSGCVAFSSSLSSAVQRQDHVFAELKKEEQLTNEIRELHHKQICILLCKLSSLKEVRTRLLADFQDKSEAIKIITKCSIQPFSTSSFDLPASQYKPSYVSYDQWLSHCKDLRLTADNLTKDSSSFRRNLCFTLVNLKNAQERQRHRSGDAMRKKINELSRNQDTMMWERQRLRNEMSDRTNDVQKVAYHIGNCESKLHLVTKRLDILNQRPRLELCLDKPFFSLTLEHRDLANMAAGLCPILKRSQQDLKLTHRRLMILEDKMAKNAHILEGEEKCQNLHQSFLPALDTSVANNTKLRTGSCSAYSYLL
ncbi:tektin-5-like [Cyclopterus lumpus]|uniref:tektin-5-like n=1 Tax=Cyclopterus lumpus TaxID=8103 RepID=UPI001486C912|nr:tektin-5-like [Cyclopterus lumpus]